MECRTKVVSIRFKSFSFQPEHCENYFWLIQHISKEESWNVMSLFLNVMVWDEAHVAVLFLVPLYHSDLLQWNVVCSCETINVHPFRPLLWHFMVPWAEMHAINMAKTRHWESTNVHYFKYWCVKQFYFCLPGAPLRLVCASYNSVSVCVKGCFCECMCEGLFLCNDHSKTIESFDFNGNICVLFSLFLTK